MTQTLIAHSLLTETGIVAYPRIEVEDGTIAAIEPGTPNDSAETLAAGFFDIHVHGAVSRDFMTARGEEIDEAGRFLATRGVAHYLPTTVTGPLDLTYRALERLADAIEAAPAENAAKPVGIHLEGPFISHVRRGVHPVANLLEPNGKVFDRFQQAARGHIRLLTIAPELPCALDLMRHASAAGVRISMGHTDADMAEAEAGIAAGATSATHTFNAMRPLNQRDPGILGVTLDHSDLYAELICDGVHVHPSMVRLWLKMKGLERGILVTDGISATGMGDGTYSLGDIQVEVVGGVCRSGGALAGSVLTLDKAVENVRHFTGTSLAGAVGLASHNPARMLGLSEMTMVTVGGPANFNIFDDQGKRTGSILRGVRLAAG